MILQGKETKKIVINQDLTNSEFKFYCVDEANYKFELFDDNI